MFNAVVSAGLSDPTSGERALGIILNKATGDYTGYFDDGAGGYSEIELVGGTSGINFVGVC